MTGTGTDCIVIAAPVGTNVEHFAGLHTDVGAAIGGAVYEAVKRGGALWVAEQDGSRGKDGKAVLAEMAD